MIENLAQLKRAVKVNSRFEIIEHRRADFVGQIRVVTAVNTVGCYSIVEGDPEHEVSRANNGLGYSLSWVKAAYWKFHDGICTQFRRPMPNADMTVAISFRLLEPDSEIGG